MPDLLIYLTPILAGIAAVFAILAFFRAGRPVEQDSAVQEKILQLVRLECDRVRQSADNHARNLRQELNDNLRGSREEIIGSFRQLGGTVAETLDRAGTQQKECLDNVTKSLHSLIEKHERAQEALRQSVEGRLDAIRNANEVKLDEMRRTVDEKLQSTLNERFGQSFKLVSDQLQKVSHSLGQMQELASGVGDLTRVLTHVRPRGIWGETQLGSLLEDFLAADQFARWPAPGLDDTSLS